MLIGIDWDKTYTADPDFWDLVISCAEQHDHEFVIVTGRKKEHEIKVHASCNAVDIVYADGKLKREAAEKVGYLVDVWIDDEPGTIEKCRILDWD